MNTFRERFENRRGIAKRNVTGVFNVETYDLVLEDCHHYRHEVDGIEIKDTAHQALLIQTRPDGYIESESRGFSATQPSPLSTCPFATCSVK